MKRGENPPIVDPLLELGLTGEQLGSDAASSFNVEDWLEALQLIAKHYRMPMSVQGTKLAAAADLNIDDNAKIRAMARHMGLGVRLVDPAKISLSTWHLPFVLMFKDKQLAVVHTLSKDGQASVWLSGEEGLEQPFALNDLLAETERVVLARPSKTVPDARVDAYIKPYEENWLRRIVFRDISSYGHVLIASLIANTLGLAGVLFSMQVYDRVVPAQSFNTLYVLFSGVLLAIFLIS
ncbi:hypothetical protein [Brucella rhizosphaerae]|uniref:hypothetical protein n=1 Tax=Brucella rhizosphaerae TaxID=571254 RepID=UPI0036074564